MKYFKNTSWLFAEKILRMAVGLFVSVWIARYLGPEKFGLLNYAQSFVQIFAIFASFGVDKIVLRELVKDQEQKDVLLGTAFGLKLVGAFTVLLILLIAINFTSNDSSTNTLIFIIASSTIFQSFNVIDIYFQSKVLSKYVVYANTITLLISTIVKIILLLNNAPLISFAIVVVFDSFILALGLLYFYTHQKFSVKNWKFDKIKAIELLKNSWPLIFTGLVIMIQVRIDQVMLKEMVGNAEVGYYSVAIKLIEYFNVIALILNNSLFPSLMTDGKINYARLGRLYQIQFYMGIAFMIFVFLSGEYLVEKLYGIEYILAGELFVLSALRIPLTALSLVRSSFITLENLFKYSLFVFAVSALINISFNYFLIPTYGAKGAIIATIITSIYIFINDYFYKNAKINFTVMMRYILFKGAKI